ncbi:TIR domain-containing protein [Lentzea sp. NBC_00516]|uniref:TIR domain-containing protein n=1 Tax=Lentzea sp. NBC_00516 TaxID=2903582 RepID=UPI002E80EB4C|nr:TIR domain-containing protein [Lentzea sp. NBC_00516]WUD26462.1 TIR domain-containing protein [Lentzea sp. NBC_00516]
MPESFVVCAADIDVTWAQWIARQLEGAGVPVHVDAGSRHRLVDVAAHAANSQAVLLVLSPTAVADEALQARWAIAAANSPTQVGVIVRPCQARAQRVIELSGLDDQAARHQLLNALGLAPPPSASSRMAGDSTSLAMVEHLVNAVPKPQDHEQVASAAGSLSRLRLLSERAEEEMGQLAGGLRFEAGLYVPRDVEEELLAGVHAPGHRPLVLYGPPGAGKTSLVWGLSRQLLRDGNRDVHLLKATWLYEKDVDGAPIVARHVLTEAVHAAVTAGRACTILIDTVDLLVNDDVTWMALRTLVSEAHAAGASVVVTSRPAEARRLPDEWQLVELRDYDTVRPPGGSSEFERAVAAHCRVYCTAQVGHEMADKLISAVARRQHLGVLARKPLTLRMLFELYAPTTIYDDVDVTGLHRKFWADRVCQDRRAWHGWAPASTADVNLENTAALLALHMLITGVPEIALNEIAPVSAGTFYQEVELLVQRGVGALTTVSGQTAFRFFHQTFFEFAAARTLLLIWGVQGLALLEERCRAQPNDYFMLAVFEQTWLCAWPDGAFAADANAMAGRFLTDAGAVALPAELRTTVLRVTAQSGGVSAECLEQLGEVLATAELPEVRDCLALMPSPVRTWEQADVDVLHRCVQRGDSAWLAVLKVLERLGHRDRNLAARAMEKLDLGSHVASLSRQEFGDHRELLQQLGSLLHVAPDVVMDQLRVLCSTATTHGLNTYVIDVFNLLSAHADAVPEFDLGQWADEVVPISPKRTHTAVVAHAELHKIQTARVAATAGGWSRQLAELKTLIGRMDTNRDLAWLDIVRLGGMVSAFAWHAPPSTTAAALVTVLRTVSSNQVHGELRRGWLVDFGLRQDNAVTRAWTSWLSDGLPASQHKQHTPEQNWAETARRALESPRLPESQIARLADQVAVRLVDHAAEGPAVRDAPLTPWTDADLLLRLVVRSMLGGSRTAREAVRHIAANPGVLGNARAMFVKQLVPTDTLNSDALMLFDIALGWAERRVVQDFLMLPGFAARAQARATQVRELVDTGVASPKERDQSASAKLLRTAIDTQVLSLPTWHELTAWLRQARQSVHLRQTLIELIGTGVEEGRYEPGPARTVVESYLSDRNTADATAARTVLVVLLAKWFDDEQALLDTAFRDPVDGPFIAPVSSYVQPGHRRGRAVNGAEAVRFMLTFGRRLRGAPPRTQKDTAIWWRAAMRELLSGASGALQMQVIDAFPELDDEFVSSLVLQLKPDRHPQVREALNDLVQDSSRNERLRRNARLVLADGAPQRGWPQLRVLLRDRQFPPFTVRTLDDVV